MQNLHLNEYSRMQHLLDNRREEPETREEPREKNEYVEEDKRKQEELLKEMLTEFELLELTRQKLVLSEAEYHQLVQEKIQDRVKEELEARLYQGEFVLKLDRLERINKGFQQVQFGYSVVRKSKIQQEFVEGY